MSPRVTRKEGGVGGGCSPHSLDNTAHTAHGLRPVPTPQLAAAGGSGGILPPVTLTAPAQQATHGPPTRRVVEPAAGITFENIKNNHKEWGGLQIKMGGPTLIASFACY